MNRTKINWCGYTWNPTVGCTKIAQGCANCYATQLHTTRYKAFLEGKKLPIQYAKSFNEIQFFPERLHDPGLRSKKPSRIFVNSMSDLFHEDIPFGQINSVYETMGFHKQHTFLVLTKRIDRALEYYNWTSIFNAFGDMPNVQVIYSASTQKELEAGIDDLSRINASVKGLSLEPLIGPIDLSNANRIDWVITGHESGKNRRQGTTDDVRSIVDDCKGHNIPVWVEQLQLGFDNEVTDRLEDFPEDLRIRELPSRV
jgi:protein gp37